MKSNFFFLFFFSGKLLELIVIPADNGFIKNKTNESNFMNEQQQKPQQQSNYLLKAVNQNDNIITNFNNNQNLERFESTTTTGSSSTIASTITAPSSTAVDTPTRELSPITINRYPSVIKTASPSILYQYHQHHQQQYKTMPQHQHQQQQQQSTLSPLTEQKLRNLQQALTEHYSKERLNELGIVIPDLIDKTKRNQQYNEYNNKSPIINNIQKKLNDNNSRQSSISSLSPTSYFNNQQQQQRINDKIQSPTIFSKYIESVHKALNNNNNNNQINKENIQDFLNNNNELSISKRFVEHRRQLFESQNSLSQKSTENLLLQKEQQQQQQKDRPIKQLRKFSMQSAPELTTSSQSPSHNNKNLNKQITIDYYQDYHDNQLNNLIKTLSSNSGGSISTISPPQPQPQTQHSINNDQLQTISINFIQNNNNKNNPLYSSECKRLMSRGYLESIAERAAHFEDIDPERYNRLKMKISTISNTQSGNNEQNSDLNTINLQHVTQQQQQQQDLKNKQDLNPKYEPLVARYYYTGTFYLFLRVIFRTK